MLYAVYFLFGENAFPKIYKGRPTVQNIHSTTHIESETSGGVGAKEDTRDGRYGVRMQNALFDCRRG